MKNKKDLDAELDKFIEEGAQIIRKKNHDFCVELGKLIGSTWEPFGAMELITCSSALRWWRERILNESRRLYPDKNVPEYTSEAERLYEEAMEMDYGKSTTLTETTTH